MSGQRPHQHKPRSEWLENAEVARFMKSTVPDGIEPDLRVFDRRVGDGYLRAMYGHMPPSEKLHLSIAHLAHDGTEGRRYPNWDEIADARYRLLPDAAWMAMLLPPPDDYVAIHATTFHLHEIERPENS